jgi:hypothetical protein
MMSCGRRRCRSGSSSDCGRLNQLEGHDDQGIARIVGSLLPAAVPHFRSTFAYGKAPLFALLAVAGGMRQAPALSLAAFGVKENDWLRGRNAGSFTNSKAGKDGDDGDEAALRVRFNTGVARVATRLLKLAPRAVPEIVLYPCPDGRTAAITCVTAATQPGTVRRLALCDFVSQTEQLEALAIWELACAAWGASSLRDLVIGNRHTNAQFSRELSVAAAQCPHLEVSCIPRIVLPPSFVASMVEGSSAAGGGRCFIDPDGAAPDGCPKGPCPHTVRRFDFAPYPATLRSLELSQGPDNATELAFIATQLPSLRCLILAAEAFRTERIPSAVWRRGLRQLLRQLHKLYICELSHPLRRALNTLHALAASDADRSIAVGLPPNAMSAVLLSDPDEPDDSDDFDDSGDDAPIFDSPVSADAPSTEDIPLQLFSIFAFNDERPYSTAPFMRYLGKHAPCVTEVAPTRSTSDTVAELATMRGSCRALDLRDVHGLTDTIIASILKHHRATLRLLAVDNIVDDTHEVKYDPQVYKNILGDRDTPQGAPFTKLARVAFDDFGWSDEQRAYFSYLLPGLCDPRAPGLFLMPN